MAARLALSTTKSITDLIKSKYCKSQKQLLECLQEMISIKLGNSFLEPAVFDPDQVDQAQLTDLLIPILINQANGLDQNARKEAIRCLALIAEGIKNKEELVPYRSDILSLLQETKCDKAKPVRDATTEALALFRQIDAELQLNGKQFKASEDYMQKELTLGSPNNNPLAEVTK